jgi:hypothetical protein
MKLYVHGFWDGFIEKTDVNNVDFFINLFEEVFKERIIIGNSLDECDIFLESIFSRRSILDVKPWKYSFCFYGESKENCIRHCGQERLDILSKYTCVLCGEKNHDNVVNLPLFVPYIYGCGFVNKLEVIPNLSIVPPRSVCAIINNPNGYVRNRFLDHLEKVIHIDYAGPFRNNISDVRNRQDYEYNSEAFSQFVSKYKFIVSMENSKEGTYITEKITHGLNAGIIPIYWGSDHICDYFNKDRFINLENDDDITIQNAINKIMYLINNPEEYLKTINQPVFPDGKNQRSMDEVIKDIKTLILPKPYPLLQKVYAIASPEFEPYRYEKMTNIMSNLGIKNVEYICPTYKHTITDEIYAKWVVDDSICRNYAGTGREGMRKSELSLFLNHIALLENIEKNYSDGIFLVLESDAIPLPTIDKFHDLLEMVYEKRDRWDLISLGQPYSERMFHPFFAEDLTVEGDSIRLIQKKFTRCTDSLLWSYSGVKKVLEILKTETNYCLPIDTFIDDIIIPKHPEFKLYWSTVSFFHQTTFFGGEASTNR